MSYASVCSERKKNVIIHGVTESARENLTDKRADDDAKIKEIFKTVGKEDIAPIYFRWLRSKDTSKPGPILVELTDVALRNPLLLAEIPNHLKSQESNLEVSERLRQLSIALKSNIMENRGRTI